MTDTAGGSGGTWKRWVAILGISVLLMFLLAGGFLVVAIGAISSAAGGMAAGGCVPMTAAGDRPSPASIRVGETVSVAVAESMEIPRGESGTVTLNRQQLSIAAAIIGTGQQLEVPAKGIKVALMTALQESVLRMYANSTVPESLDYPHDAVGSDHDSVNPFQQRPASGWGTVAELMNLDYSIRAFFGGENGPNGGSPRGLLDIPGWEQMTPGQAAQRVQVSAFPDAYDKWERAAELLMGEVPGVCGGSGTGIVIGTGGWVSPVKAGTNLSSSYGPRASFCTPGGCTNPFHAGIDLPQGCGEPIVAAADGVVRSAGANAAFGNAVFLDHNESGAVVTTVYAHMQWGSLRVVQGQSVRAGDVLGLEGTTGRSRGCHLHYEVRINGSSVDPQAFMAARGIEYR